MRNRKQLAFIHLKWAPVVGAVAMIAMIAMGTMKPPDGRGGGGKGGKGGDPPAAVTDLTVTGITHDSITIEWTASGNNGTEGTAAAYDIRYLIGEFITDANWDDAIQVFATPTPQASGTAELFTIHRLMGGQSYDIGLKVINGGDTASELANLPDPLLPVTLIAVAGQWDPELVIQTSRNRHSDFDLHPTTDQPAIAYGDEANNVLWFTYFDEVEGMWKSEVMRTGAGGGGLGLQYDPAGLPTVTIEHNGLLFGTREVTDCVTDCWSFETVDSGTVGGIHRPVFNPADNPSVVYQLQNVSGKGKNRTATSSLHYAVRVGGAWQRETIDVSNADHAMFASLAYDQDGNAAVSYIWQPTDGARELKLARRTGLVTEPWTTQIVRVFSDGSPSQTSLAFDPSGMPMIAQRAKIVPTPTGNTMLYVASLDGANWQYDLVDPVSTSAQDPTLLFDATGTPVIAYRSSNEATLQHQVLLASFNGLAWDIEVADTSLSQAEWFSDVLNNVHFRFDALGEPWVHFNINHLASTPNTDELFLTRRVGN